MDKKQLGSRKRLDRLLAHLKAEPDDIGTSIGTNDTKALTPPRRVGIASSPVSSSSSSSTANGNGLRVNDGDNNNALRQSDDTVFEPIVAHCTDDEEHHAPRTRDSRRVNSQDKLVRLCRALNRLGICGSNVEDVVSLRDDENRGAFWIKPLGVRFDEVEDGTHLMRVTNLEEALLSRSHQEMYQAHPEITCIIEGLHADCATVALSSSRLLPLSNESLRIYGKVRIADEANLGLRCQRAKGVSGWLVRNRGFVSCGASAEMALLSAVYLTRACTFQVRAMMAVGGDLKRLHILGESDIIRFQASIKVKDEEIATSIFEHASAPASVLVARL